MPSGRARCSAYRHHEVEKWGAPSSRLDRCLYLESERNHARSPLRARNPRVVAAPRKVPIAALCALYWSELSDWTYSMPKPVPLPPPGFDDLSVDEKIDYLQSLWDRIAATPETIPVPEWHREILDERLKDLEADPDAGESWEVVQERLRKKLDSRR